MKLTILTVLIIKYTVGASEHYSFPPQFHKPNQGGFGSDSSIFLPPEAHTPVPYFAMKNVNNLPFPYLPPTGTKAPAVYPSPFPVILSSTLVPIFDDDDDSDEKDDMKRNNKQRISSPMPPMHQMKQNSSENSARAQMSVKREMRSTPKMGNYHNPIDRIDMRYPQHFPMGPTTPSPTNQTPRNIMIIDTHRNDHVFDHMKSSSAQNPHYVAAAHGFTISSTTEPAIPILRLSNEMDLDGSFSYEALGADQTHYVQHSHMENMGSDKQEQVVEGSYSYVGDNGQTYTVNYIADSNGFRASGDHLPVAPPIPEIIQRAVQYNLAEEAKKPPHLRGWQNEEKDYDASDRGQQFAAPPPRNLFTGRTPEAFSYGFSQGANNENNLAAASSQQVSVKTNADFIIDQTRAKANNGPIAPQITFLASQGAHVPSMNQQNSQQSIARVFNNEKPTMPQLVNYEASNKEAEQDSNKGLWRWQYGLNSNNLSQTPEKNAISRSFGEGDDIMINFGDMTPEQYTNMLQSQLEPSTKETSVSSQLSNGYDKNYNSNQNNKNNMQKNINEYRNHEEANYYSPVNTIQNQPSESQQVSTFIPYTSSSPREYNYKNSEDFKPDNLSTPKPHNNINPLSQSDQSDADQYEYQENPYEFRRIKALHVDSATKSNMNNINVIPVSNQASKLSYNSWANNKYADDETHTITQVPAFYNTVSAPKFLNIYEEKTEFKPIFEHFNEEKRETSTTTPQTTTESILKNNMFLQHLLKAKKPELQNINNKIAEEPKKVEHNNIINEQKHIMQIPSKTTAEIKEDKIHKFIPHQTKIVTENKSVKQKPLDISDVLNYITNKNLFESSKTKTKSNGPISYENYHPRNEMRFEPFQYEKNEEPIEHVRHQSSNFRKFNDQEKEELRGMIKNYKVLQRNHNAKNSEQNGYQIRKEVTPPSIRMLQSPGLPPLGRAGPSMKTYLPPIYV